MLARKKPGRPRKRVDVCPVGVHGIVAEPAIADDCVEFVYNQPQLFKCIVSVFKEYDSDEIVIEFHPDRIVFTGKDHSQLVAIHITINAADMNLYYFSTLREVPQTPKMSIRAISALISGTPADDDDECDEEPIAAASASASTSASTSASASASASEPRRIVVKRDNLEIVTAIIEKTHYKMMMSLKRDDMSSLYITLSSCEYDSEDSFEVSIVPRPSIGATTGIEMPDLATYPLEFTLDSHHLKRKIGELKKISPNMIIKKIGTSDLEITFGAVARVAYTGTYKAASKIKLRSSIEEGTIFVATMSIGRIRPLMTVNMPGGITFFANQVDPLVVQVGLDQRPDNHHAIVARLLINTTH